MTTLIIIIKHLGTWKVSSGYAGSYDEHYFYAVARALIGPKHAHHDVFLKSNCIVCLFVVCVVYIASVLH